MTRTITLIALAVISLLLLSSCQKKPSANVLPEPKFVSVYAKLTTATVTAHPVTPDSLGSARTVDSILSLEGVTREQFDSTVSWYNQDVTRWKPFFDEVVAVLEESVKVKQNPPQPQVMSRPDYSTSPITKP